MTLSLQNTKPPYTKTSPEQLFSCFEKLNITYYLHRHDPVFTVEESAPLKKNIPGIHCRNLFLKCKTGRLVLVTAANDTAIDLKLLAREIGAKRFSFGKADLLDDVLGVIPGAVCPYAVVNDTDHQVDVILDKAMMKGPLICHHPLDNAMTIGVSPQDLLRFMDHTGHKPTIHDFSHHNS